MKKYICLLFATLSDADEQPEDNDVQLSEGSEAATEADESNDTADNNS